MQFVLHTYVLVRCSSLSTLLQSDIITKDSLRHISDVRHLYSPVLTVAQAPALVHSSVELFTSIHILQPEHLLNVTRAPPLKQLHLSWTLDDTWYIRESKVCLWWSSEISLLHYNPSKYSHCCRLSWFSLTSVFSSAKPKTQRSSHLHYHNCRCQPTPTSTTVFFHVYVSLRRQKIHSSSANANFRLFSKVFQHNTLTSVSIL